MNAKFVSADTGTTTRLVNTNGNTNSFLGPPKLFTPSTHPAASNTGGMEITTTRHVASLVTSKSTVVTLFVTICQRQAV